MQDALVERMGPRMGQWKVNIGIASEQGHDCFLKKIVSLIAKGEFIDRVILFVFLIVL